MLSRFRAAGLIWPTIFALPLLAFLLGLGNWQMQRKAWKDGLIAQMRDGLSAEPGPIGGHLVLDLDKHEYMRIRTRGRFLHSQERHLYWPLGGRSGVLVLTPMVLADERIVLVNRGWVPDELRDPAKRASGQASGDTMVTGLLRAPEKPGRFTPANDGGRNAWYWRDVASMVACHRAPPDAPDCRALVGPPLAPMRLPAAYPFSIDAEAEPVNPGGWPRGGTTNLNLPNKHLEYALTWYGLALTLVGVFLAFCISRLRGAPLPPRG